jgi:transposase/FtsZ-binding cell division protein ZapB
VVSEPRTESLSLPSEPDKLVALVTSLVTRIDRLESEVKDLRVENTTLRTENAELRQTVEGLRQDNARLRRENAWLKKQLFGPKRERVDPGRLHVAWAKFQAEQGVAGVESIPAAGIVATPSTAMQLLLGLTAPESAPPVTVARESDPNVGAAPPPPPPSRTPRPHHAHGRSTLPEHLPVERVVLEPTVIPAGARRMGEEISERVGYRKASYVRVLVIRPKYAVDEADGTTGFAMADTPDEMIPRGLCDPAMLAHLIMGKWGDHLPWNRLEGICARQGLPLSANTMAGAAKRAEPLAKRVVDAMWADARAKAKVLGVDASTAKVQAKGKCRKGYPWVVVADRDHVLFNFSARHSSDVPRELLRGFRGFVLADASSVYDRLFAAEDAPIEAGCRVGGGVAAPAPHRPGRARLTHPVLHRAGSLTAA